MWRDLAASNGLREHWRRWRSTAACMGVCLLCTVALAWLGNRSQQTRLGQSLDQAGMDVVVGDEATTRGLVGVLGNVSLGSIAVAVLVLVGVAVIRGRYSAAGAAAALVVGANLTTQVMKAVTERADHGYLTVESFPSGHATVVVSLVFAALLVVPDAARTTVSLIGSGAVTVTGAATLVASWHRPSDIVGALLVSLVWGTAVLAVWSLLRGGMPDVSPARPHRIFATTGVVLAVAGLLAGGVRPGGGWGGFLDAGVVLGGIGLAAALGVTTYAQLAGPMAVAADARSGTRHPAPEA